MLRLKSMLTPVLVSAFFLASPCMALAQPTSQQKDLVRADAAFSAVQKRIALVVGNKDYTDAPLKNPVNDAEGMSQTLTALGFEVILKTNVTNRQLVAAVDEFAGKLGPNTIGLFYFSGHGVQVDGVNYLVPLNYHIERQSDVAFEAFPAQRLLSAMGGASCPLNIIILDACRDNPLPKSIKALGDKGLGKMDAPSGTFIAYATAPGQTASDDPDKSNGLYTGVLLQKMKIPGLKIEEVFKTTRVSVTQASGGRQTPWDESSLQNDFYFAAGIPNPLPIPAPAPVVVPGNGAIVDTKGKLQVTVNAANAVVTVNGQSAPGGVFMLNLLDETEKQVQVKVVASGYEGQLVNVTLLRGKTVSQSVVLEQSIVPVTMPQSAQDWLISHELLPADTVYSNTSSGPDRDFAEGNSKLQMGDNSGAVEAYLRAIKTRPIFPDAYFNRGLAYSKLKQYDKAVFDFTKYVGYKPRIADGYLERAHNHAGAKQYTAAIEDYDKALLLKPTLLEIYFDRACSYREMGEYDKAIRDYTDYIRFSGTRADPLVYKNRGLVYFDKSDLPNAKNDLTTYNQLRPGDPYVTQILSKIAEAQKGAVSPNIKARIAESTNRVAPDVPEKLRNENFSYRITVRVTIFPDGKHKDEISSGSGVASIDQAVLAAASRTKWRPAMIDGKPITTEQTIIYNFSNK